MTISSRRFGSRVKRRSHLEIRDLAMRVRRVLQVAGTRIDMLDLLENRLDSRGIRYHYAPQEELGEDIARWVPSEGRIVVALLAHESLSNGEPDHMLLIPHELGHVVLNHTIYFGWATTEADHALNEDSEWQADIFALEFTMPYDLVIRLCRSVDDIMTIFGVTRRDATARVMMLRAERAIPW